MDPYRHGYCTDLDRYGITASAICDVLRCCPNIRELTVRGFMQLESAGQSAEVLLRPRDLLFVAEDISLWDNDQDEWDLLGAVPAQRVDLDLTTREWYLDRVDNATRKQLSHVSEMRCELPRTYSGQHLTTWPVVTRARVLEMCGIQPHSFQWVEENIKAAAATLVCIDLEFWPSTFFVLKLTSG